MELVSFPSSTLLDCSTCSNESSAALPPPLMDLSTNLSRLERWAMSNDSSFDECRPMQVAAPDLIDDLYVRILLGTCYALIWVLGVGGNSLVLYMVLWRRLDFSVRTVFIVALSCSDLIMALTSLPVTAISTFTRVWRLPSFLCYSIGLLQASSVFVSSFTLIMIAVDRYYLICYPHSVKITYRRALAAVGVFWGIGVTLAIPMSLFMRMENLDEKFGVCGYGCVEDWPDALMPFGKRAYGLAVFIIQYGFPMVLCSILYVEIGLQISEQFERRKKTQVISAETTERSLQRRRRTNRMMVSMVLSFILSWLPFNLANLVRDFDLFNYILPVAYFQVTFAVGHAIAMTSVLWNPCIYSFFNPQFRASVKQILARRTTNYHPSPGETQATMATGGGNRLLKSPTTWL